MGAHRAGDVWLGARATARAGRSPASCAGGRASQNGRRSGTRRPRRRRGGIPLRRGSRGRPWPRPRCRPGSPRRPPRARPGVPGDGRGDRPRVGGRLRLRAHRSSARFRAKAPGTMSLVRRAAGGAGFGHCSSCRPGAFASEHVHRAHRRVRWSGKPRSAGSLTRQGGVQPGCTVVQAGCRWAVGPRSRAIGARGSGSSSTSPSIECRTRLRLAAVVVFWRTSVAVRLVCVGLVRAIRRRGRCGWRRCGCARRPC